MLELTASFAFHCIICVVFVLLFCVIKIDNDCRVMSADDLLCDEVMLDAQLTIDWVID